MPRLNQTSTSHSSAQALALLGNAKKKCLLDQIMDICLAAQRNGADDLSGKEIQAKYELIHGKRIEAGTVSGRVNDLVSAKRLERLTFSRACAITSRDIYPVRVPAAQARLMY